MTKYFNFGILVTTISIVSVAHAFMTSWSMPPAFSGYRAPSFSGYSMFGRRSNDQPTVIVIKEQPPPPPPRFGFNTIFSRPTFSPFSNQGSLIPASLITRDFYSPPSSPINIIPPSTNIPMFGIFRNWNRGVNQPSPDRQRSDSPTSNKQTEVEPQNKNALNSEKNDEDTDSNKPVCVGDVCYMPKSNKKKTEVEPQNQNALNSEKNDEDTDSNKPVCVGDVCYMPKSNKKKTEAEPINQNALNSEKNTTTCDGDSCSLPWLSSKNLSLPTETQKPEEISIDFFAYVKPEGMIDILAEVIRDEILERTNFYRNRHGCEPLKLDNYMNNHAQLWANILKQKNQLIERTKEEGGIYGQTIGESSTMIDIGKKVVDTWYNELRFLKGGDSEFDLNNNPRTIKNVLQLLSKKPNRMGVGVALNDNNKYFIVAEYNSKAYPIILSNLPKFQRQDIEDAAMAHNKTIEKDNSPLNKGQLSVPNYNSNGAKEYNAPNQNTKGSPIEDRSKWRPNLNPPSKTIMDPFGVSKTVNMPAEFDPLDCKDSEPFMLTPREAENIRKDVLDKINHYRKMYDIPLLVRHNLIDCYAQEWANTLAKKNKFEHRRTFTEYELYGENIHSYAKVKYSGELAVDLWYYKLGLLTTNETDKTYSSKSGIRFITQLLWKRTAQLGVGVAVNRNGHLIIVANFNPKGNIDHFYEDNLPKFTQAQIDDAIASNQSIQKALREPVSIEEGQLPKIPGWNSELHDKNQMTPASQSGQIKKPLNKFQLRKPVPKYNSAYGENVAPRNKQLFSDYGVKTYKMPDYEEPEKYEFFDPVGITLREVEDIRKDVLEKTNYYRDLYEIPKLELHDHINNFAQKWANTLANDRKFKLSPRDGTNPNYGENIYKVSTMVKYVGEHAVDSWYNEVRFIVAEETEDTLFKKKGIKFLTQLLWKDSKEMGVGAAADKEGNVIIVANFNPRGNIEGFFLNYLPFFGQDQIDDGQALDNTVKEAIKNPVDVIDGELPMMPGWESMLHEEDQTTPASKTANNKLPLNNNQPTKRNSFSNNEPPRSKQYPNNYGVNTYKMPDYVEPEIYEYCEPVRLTPDEVENIRQDVLAKTNSYRDIHEIPRLEIHNQINNFAQKWANTLANDGKFKLSPRDGTNPNYGENIYKVSTMVKYVGEHAVDSWYNEVRFIVAEETEDTLFKKKGIKFLTQLLWKDSKEMGVGAAVDFEGNVIIVANFNPRGNVEKFFLDYLPPFEQPKIDQGKLLDEKNKKAIQNPVDVIEGELPMMPGWESVLHKNDKMTPASKTANNHLPLNTNELTKPVSRTNSTDGRDELPREKEISTPYGKKTRKLPDIIEPPYFGYVEPVRITRKQVEDIRKDVLDKINHYREMYQIPKLEINENMNNYAQDWANQLTTAPNVTTRGCGPPNYGENLYKTSALVWYFGEFTVDMWYYNIKSLTTDENEETLFAKRGIKQLTQFLWRDSKHLGVGVALDKQGNVILVADFNPQGNIEYFYLQNLPKFSRDQIDFGQKSYDKVAEGIKTPLSLIDGLPKLNGWESVLHSDTKMTQASKTANNNLPPNTNQLTKPVPNSNRTTGQNSIENCINNSAMKSGCHTFPRKKNVKGRPGVMHVLPDIVEPMVYDYYEPLGLTREEVEEIRKDVLAKTNYYRIMHDVQVVEIHEQIDHFSQEWANNLATERQMYHRGEVDGKPKYGENLYYSSAKFRYIGEIAVDKWYFEIGLITPYETDDSYYNKDGIGHFTQLLWKDTTQMGVGAAKSRDGYIFIVANYNPAGNIGDFYLENLPVFTQAQIDEGFRLNDKNEKEKKKGYPVLNDGQLPKMPGWDSVLHEKKNITSASKNNPTLPGQTKLFIYNGQPSLVTMPADTEIQYHGYETPLGLSVDEVIAIRSKVLSRINSYRQNHGCQSLIENSDMNYHAQNWANNLGLRNQLKEKTDEENGNNIYRQTIFVSSLCDNVAEIAVDTWYNELRFIRVGDDDDDLYRNSDNIGHVIQLLWKRSKNIGIGVAKNATNKYFIVAEYNPNGNYYPFLIEYLPTFQQKDIDAAKTANEKLEKSMPLEKMPIGDNGRIKEPVPSPNKPIGQSNWIPSENPFSKTVQTHFGPRKLKMPAEKYPRDHPKCTPLGLSPEAVEEIRNDILQKTNHYRRKHGLGELVLDERIDNYAQDWANQLATKNYAIHRPQDNNGRSVYGENHDEIPYVKYVGEVIVDLWYYEIRFINLNDTEEQLNTNENIGHATALLWKRSVQMGVGAAINVKNRITIVVNYNPPGNVKFFFYDNLPIFTQEHINDAQRLRGIIDTKKDVKIDTVTKNPTMIYPGWQTVLHANDPTTSASQMPVSNTANGGNGSQQYTKSSSTRQPKWKPDPIVYEKEALDPQGNLRRWTMPLEYEVQDYPKPEPHILTEEEIEEIRIDTFKKTNYYRTKHGLEELELHEQLDHYAQEWANHLARNNAFYHREQIDGRSLYGENLGELSNVLYVGEAIVDAWYNEISLLKVTDNGDQISDKAESGAGHATALLWKRTAQMGVGASKNGQGRIILVVNYNPPGNFPHFFDDFFPKLTQKDINEAQIAENQKNEPQKITPLYKVSGKPTQRFPGWTSYLHPISKSVYRDKGVTESDLAGLHNWKPNPIQIQKTIFDGYSMETTAKMPVEEEPRDCTPKRPYNITPTEVEDIRKDVLAKTNHYRNMYGIRSLVLNEKIDCFAQEWANYLALNNKFEHRDQSALKAEYGENLNESNKVLYPGELAVDSWYYEMGLVQTEYDEEDLESDDTIKHMTQLLWKQSAQMGVGAAISRRGKIIVVANYNPTGNIENFYLDNLPKFNQEQIDEGKKFLANIKNVNEGKVPRRLLNAPLAPFPGWTSYLHNNE